MASDISVAMVFSFDPTTHSGIGARLADRLRLWSELGQRAHVFACCRPTSRISELELPGDHQLTPVIGKNSFDASRRLPAAMAAHDIDVVYLRANPFPASFKIARRWPTVLEIHGDPRDEAAQLPLHSRILNARLPALLRAVHGLVLVDPSLTQSPTFAKYAHPLEVITNGIVLPPSPEIGDKQTRRTSRMRAILSAGSGYAWQGIPKYLQIAAQMPEVDFVVAGGVEAPTGTELPRNVEFVGRLSSDDLADMLMTMDFGFGNLSLELARRRTPSPLKVREYVAQGLPTIIAHDDPDLQGAEGVLDLGYGFELTPEVVSKLRAFMTDWHGRRVPELTRQAVSATPKERARISYLRDVARRADK